MRRFTYDDEHAEWLAQMEGAARLVRAAQALYEGYERMTTIDVLEQNFPSLDEVWAALDYIEGV